VGGRKSLETYVERTKGSLEAAHPQQHPPPLGNGVKNGKKGRKSSHRESKIRFQEKGRHRVVLREHLGMKKMNKGKGELDTQKKLVRAKVISAFRKDYGCIKRSEREQKPRIKRVRRSNPF